MTQQPYYPPAPGGYPPPPAQQYPPQPAAPAYPPQYAGMPPGYPPATVAPPAPAPPPLAQGSIDDYYSQPASGGGGGLKFTGPNNQPLINQSYVFQVTRAITTGDIPQQTNNQGAPQFFKDGRPKFVMIVPCRLLEPSPNHPDGLAKWYVKGATREELSRAMSAAGAPAGPPEAGAVIRVTLTGTRPSGPGMNPAHVFDVQYVRPQGASASAPSPVLEQAPPAPQPVPAAQPPAQQYAPPVQPQYAPPAQPPAPQPVQQYAPPPVQAPAPQQAPAQAPAMQPPSDLTADQQALLAQLQQRAG